MISLGLIAIFYLIYGVRFFKTNLDCYGEFLLSINCLIQVKTIDGT